MTAAGAAVTRDTRITTRRTTAAAEAAGTAEAVAAVEAVEPGRGDIRAAVITLLAEAPMHGYQIIQELVERSGGAWRPSPGSIYPALQLLQDEGLVTAEETDGKRVFTLTDAGREQAAAHADGPTPWDAAARGEGSDRAVLRELGGQLLGAVIQVGQVGTPTQIEAAKTLLVTARRDLYRLLAEDDTTEQ